MCKIQNLLPDNCSICDRRCRISLEDPILECSVCGQGVHKPCWLNLAAISSNNTDISDTIDSDVFKSLYNPLNLPGLFFVFYACQPKTIPSDSEGDNKRKRNLALSVKAGPTIQENPSQKDPIFQNNAVPQALKEWEDDKQTASNPSTQTGTDNQEKSKSICRFYKNGNCKHG